MWILTLLHFVLLTRAIQNYTIDDASPLITYDAPVLERNITAFNSHLLWDGTVTYIAPALASSPTISIPFNGTAIYIFVAYPGRPEPAPSGFIALIDGAPAGNWAADESAQLYHHLVYHTTALPAAPHTLVMQIKPGWELYFDYAIYTSDVDLPPATISMSSTGTSKSTSLSTKSTTANKPPVGAIIGAVLGGTLLIGLSIVACCCRRRRAAAKLRLTPVRFIAGFGLDNAVAEEEEKDAGPPTMPFLSRRAPSARDRHKSVNTLPEGESPAGATTERGLARLTAEMRNLTASVQRLETGMPEARDGGQVMLHPPAYGDSRF
ncbi:hypothetical protein B0H14DRAFT_830115 [Mycena olivaceomarginata]|nr:hypothetical protein B0H14DRAFT_830115 [Mycena olivaceomarginata]